MLTKKELLEEAKKRYPIGTVVISLNSAYQKDVMKIGSFLHHTQTKNEIYFEGSYDIEGIYKGYNPCVYMEGEWAKIVELPKEVNKELIIEIW